MLPLLLHKCKFYVLLNGRLIGLQQLHPVHLRIGRQVKSGEAIAGTERESIGKQNLSGISYREDAPNFAAVGNFKNINANLFSINFFLMQGTHRTAALRYQSPPTGIIAGIVYNAGLGNFFLSLLSPIPLQANDNSRNHRNHSDHKERQQPVVASIVDAPDAVARRVNRLVYLKFIPKTAIFHFFGDDLTEFILYKKGIGFGFTDREINLDDTFIAMNQQMPCPVAMVQSNAMLTATVVEVNPVHLCHDTAKINGTITFYKVLLIRALLLSFCMTNQAAYRLFAATAPDLPLFLQPWYLDAVCQGGVWDAVLVEKGGRTVAAMPYFLKKKLFWRYIAMPQLCKFLGPYLLPEFRNLDQETRLYEALLEQLPKGLAAFQQDMNYSLTNWLPFYWRGFQQSTRYSYILSLDQPETEILRNISKNYRKKIRAASELLSVSSQLPLAELQRLLDLSFARQGLASPLSATFFQRVYEALVAHNCCKLFFALDTAKGTTHSGALLAWDGTSAYYLASGDDPALRASGSALLLKWEAILFAKNELKLPVFDFEGSMIRAIEVGRRDFGATQKPYFRIQREWSLLWRWAKRLTR